MSETSYIQRLNDSIADNERTSNCEAVETANGIAIMQNGTLVASLWQGRERDGKEARKILYPATSKTLLSLIDAQYLSELLEQSLLVDLSLKEGMKIEQITKLLSIYLEAEKFRGSLAAPITKSGPNGPEYTGEGGIIGLLNSALTDDELKAKYIETVIEMQKAMMEGGNPSGYMGDMNRLGRMLDNRKLDKAALNKRAMQQALS